MALHGDVIAAQDLQHMCCCTSWLGLEHKSRRGGGHGRGAMTARIDSRREGTTSTIGGRGGGRIGNREGSE
ncbi:unnamed protein product [Musa banksii]